MHVFAWSQYYPCGGYNDFIGTASSIEDARSMLREHLFSCEHYQIVEGSSVVESGYIQTLVDDASSGE